MKTRYTVALSMIAGAALGGVAVQGVHAQLTAKKAYTISELEVLDAQAAPGVAQRVQAAQAEAGGRNLRTDGMLFSNRDRVAALALASKLPAVYPEAEFVAAGGLSSYGPSLPDLFRRAASYVDKILKGAKAGDLPIEQPTKFELAINLKTAQALGLTISREFQLRADEVIE